MAISALSFAGCNLKSDDSAPVTGTVTLDGQPLTNGWVLFLPQQDRRGAAGLIQPDGSYELNTSAGAAAVPAGRYAVTVAANEGGEAGPAVVSPIPKRYGNRTTSGLSYEIVPGQSNRFDIQLTSQAARP